MKTNLLKNLFAVLLVIALLVLASCGATTTSESENNIETNPTTETTETGFAVTIVADENATVTVYQTKADMASATNGSTDTTAYSRDGDTGALLTDGDGQVNFTVTVKEGYIVQSITATEGTYKNIKTPTDTGVENGYRLTKITADTTITIVTAEQPAEPYHITFVTSEHVTVTVYATDDVTAEPIAVAATTVDARDGDSGELVYDATGQVNFVLVFEEGFELDGDMTVEGSYKNFKTPTDTKVEGLYRVTKIASDLTITVNAKAAE